MQGEKFRRAPMLIGVLTLLPASPLAAQSPIPTAPSTSVDITVEEIRDLLEHLITSQLQDLVARRILTPLGMEASSLADQRRQPAGGHGRNLFALTATVLAVFCIAFHIAGTSLAL